MHYLKKHHPSNRILVRFWALLCLLPCWAWAGSVEALQFERYSVEQGLTQAKVRCIHQDRLGFLWAGTEEGLNRYDGYEFLPFLNQVDNPTSLSHDNVTTILEDSDGDLWFGTEGGGLNLYDRKTQSFTRYEANPKDPKALQGGIITGMYQDTEGMIWLTTPSAGL